MGDSQSSKWLDAHFDSKAGLNTIPGCITFADITGDGDHKLVLADLRFDEGNRSRLKTYRGTSLYSDQPLPDIPSSVVSFYTDNHESKIPVVAVACGSHVLIYKNNKPYYKFTVPNLPVCALEQDCWNKLVSSEISLEDMVASLKTIPFEDLSPRSQHLLSQPRDRADEFVSRYGNAALSRPTTVTCICTLNKSSPNRDSVACLVVVTEAGHLYILDPQGFSVLHQASVCSGRVRPCGVACAGMLDVDFRCVVSCRAGQVCVLRRDWLEGRVLLHTTSPAVGMLLVPADSSVVLATHDRQLQCFSKKGKRLWLVELGAPATCMALVHLQHLMLTLVAVALRDRPIHLYSGSALVDTVPVPGAVSCMRFGHLGQEENVLVVVTMAGLLSFKILKRTADFSAPGVGPGGPGTQAAATQAGPLPLPKRSRLFAEQTLRERENALAIHQMFQKDLIRLRLRACRAVADMQRNVEQNTRAEGRLPLKLSAQVLGLGPRFTLTLAVENMGAERAVGGLRVVFHAHTARYLVARPYAELPLLPPGVTCRVETAVTEMFLEGEEAEGTPVRVFLVSDGQTLPVLAACIEMPPTDPLGFT